jgi:hypothetical protein
MHERDRRSLRTQGRTASYPSPSTNFHLGEINTREHKGRAGARCAAQAWFIASPPAARGHIKERGMRGAKRPRPVFSGQPLGAPLAASLPPLSPLTTCSAWRKARRYGPEPSSSAEEKKRLEVARLLRPRGLIATRSRKWLPPLAVVLERRGPTPHDRDGLGHASLMGQGWEEFSTGAEGGDKWCRVGEVPVADGLGGP